MSAEQNKQISRDLVEGLWNRRDWSVADQYVAADHVPQGPYADQFPIGPEGMRQFAQAFTQAFPDVRCTIDRQEAEGDLVRSWLTFTGTHTGELMGIPATHRTVTVKVLTTEWFADGQVVESVNEWDPEDMLRQLGVG